MLPALQRRASARRGSRSGGVYVVANIRGGGEFGPRWHQAALKANRHKAYEDFIAVAEDLIARKVTSDATPRRSMGGSNGGLLDGQHAHDATRSVRRRRVPGAAARHAALPHCCSRARAGWREYGNPDDPERVGVLRDFSPYHNLRAGVRYPPTLFTTSTRDDRVHPGSRAQDGGAHAASWARTSCTTRTSRAATAAPPTTASGPACGP